MKLIDFADQMNRVAQLIGNFCNLTVVQGKLIDPSNENNPRPFELSPRSFGFNQKKTRLVVFVSSCLSTTMGSTRMRRRRHVVITTGVTPRCLRRVDGEPAGNDAT